MKNHNEFYSGKVELAILITTEYINLLQKYTSLTLVNRILFLLFSQRVKWSATNISIAILLIELFDAQYITGRDTTYSLQQEISLFILLQPGSIYIPLHSMFPVKWL